MQVRAVRQYLEFLKISGIQDVFFDPKYTMLANQKMKEKLDLNELKIKYSNCQKCLLCEGRIKFVYGEGNPDAKLMLIGEGPGADENITGRPFVGRAGQLLTKMLQAIKIEREDVYITNVVKCRPPGNRDPLPSEIDSCKPYLDEQISLIKPKLILLLGKIASNSLLNLNLTLKAYRERTYAVNGIKTYITYHPSALLRNPGWKKFAWIDLQKLQKDYNSLS
ncbi:MAG: uracil-DNA glycosylase [Candidatus Cloacimonetes bacterium]|nr:uracil-DNA glycosylase [Candidatus Cloacimonadota bacterium]